MKWLLGGVALLAALLVRKREETVGPGVTPRVDIGPVLRPERTVVDRPGRHWTWEELTVSAAAVRLGSENVPGPEARANLRRLCVEVLDPLRERWPGVRMNSAYRSVTVNRAVGGVANSRHLRGLAADVGVPARERRAVVAWLRGRRVKVLEYRGHLHVAIGELDSRSRGRSLPISGGIRRPNTRAPDARTSRVQ